MKITKEDIEKRIYEYNNAIKKLEEAGVDYDNYTVTISHARWIELLTILKTHIEAWEKVKEEINSNSFHDDLGQQWMYTESIVRIIDKYRDGE